MIKHKQPFYLTQNNIESVLNKYIYPNHADIKCKIDYSHSTNSIYITFIKNTTLSVLRLSDHEQKIPIYKSFIVDKNTTEEDIVKALTLRIKQLNAKRMYYLFDKIKTKDYIVG